MRLELLDIPERRSTVMPELVAFFKDTAQDDWQMFLERFLRNFAGMEFKIPDPKFLREMARDEEIVATLRRDKSVQTRVGILRENKISHAYLQNIWRVCEGTNLEPPHTTNRDDAVSQAAAWMRKYPSLMHDIAAMFALTAHEKGKAVMNNRALERALERDRKAKQKK